MNIYDNEFVRKQLYDIHGKPNGVSYEAFKSELDTLVKDLLIESGKHDVLKAEYE